MSIELAYFIRTLIRVLVEPNFTMDVDDLSALFMAVPARDRVESRKALVDIFTTSVDDDDVATCIISTMNMPDRYKASYRLTRQLERAGYSAP